jgi:hypothetical protein
MALFVTVQDEAPVWDVAAPLATLPVSTITSAPAGAEDSFNTSQYLVPLVAVYETGKLRT